ncbi:MAG: hypothetical protein QW782_01260, partial [Candidatus Bathyarchaeia archaeon]
LTVDTPQQIRSITLKEKEPFLALDGASQSIAIGVKYKIVYPNGSASEFNTNAEKPFHLLLKNPPAGTYKITISTITSGNTTAWIQVTTLNNGTSSIDSLEKEHLHLTAGQAKYFRIKMQQDWIFFHVLRIAGKSIKLELIKLPTLEIKESKIDAFSYLYPPKSLGEGEYIFSITNQGHTDVSIIIANSKAVINDLNFNEGKKISFQIPSDVEFFWLRVPENTDWFALDGASDSSQGEGKYTIYDPEFKVLFNKETKSEIDLVNNIWRYPKPGKYLLLIWGFNFPSLTIKFTTKNNIEDLSGSPNISLKIFFPESGQVIYFNVTSKNSAILLAALDSNTWSYSVLDSEGKTLESEKGQYFGKFIGRESMLKSLNKFYFVRVQAQKGSVILHIRPRGGEDYQLDTPDYTDIRFRFGGDAIFINVSLKNCNYFAQYYASLNENSFSKFWIVDENLNLIWEKSIGAKENFLQMWRVGYELKNRPKGNWLMVSISSLAGINIRVSQLQSGDEQLRNTPYHEFNTFDFDYQLKITKISIPATRWMTAVTFTLTKSQVQVYFFDSKLDKKAQHIYGNELSLKYSIWENLPDGSWIMPVIGLKSSNISTSVIIHENLLGNATGFVKIIMSEESIRLEQEIEKYKSELQNLRNELSQLQNELSKAQSERNDLQKRLRVLETEVEAKEKMIKKLQQTIEYLSTQYLFWITFSIIWVVLIAILIILIKRRKKFITRPLYPPPPPPTSH